MSYNRILAIVSVIGQDQKGVVARVSTYLAENNVNIEDIEQKVVQGLFIMNMLVDLSDISFNLDEMINGLNGLGQKLSMDVEVRLLGRRRDKRIVLLAVYLLSE